jgi:hypothetical protein
MSFEPNNICPIASKIRADRLLKRIAARDAFAQALAPRILALLGPEETKTVTGRSVASTSADAARDLGLSRTVEPVATRAAMADVVAARRSRVGQNARRRRVGAGHD